MSNPILLPDRALLAISGEERFSFLNTLLSADVSEGVGDVRYAALLSPQGKLLADVLCLTEAEPERIIVEYPADSDFAKRLRMYKLRAAVTLEALEDWRVAVALDAPPKDAAVTFADPRDPQLGFRAYGPSASFTADGNRALYDAARIAAVVPEGSTDLEPNKALLLENGFERLSGVDFRKGCFVGQEVTARMKYRNLGKKRLMAVSRDDGGLETGTTIMAGERTAGTVLSAVGRSALALMRHEFSAHTLTLGDSSAVQIMADPDAPNVAP